jgi:hypothetical protein
MSKRDTQREREFLRAAANGHIAFAEHAEQRLSAGQELFGDSWSWAGIPRLLAEMLEEAVDLATWAVLTDQAIDLDERLSDRQREQLRAALHVAARRGAQAHALLSNVVTTYDDHRTKDTA